VSARPSGWRVAALGAVLALGGAWQAVLILAFLAAALWAEEAARALVKTVGTVRERARQSAEVDLRRLELQAALARQVVPVPAPCAHRQAVPVPGIGGNVVAWLCPQCDAQLPQDFRVPEAGR
jgi:hypothetical protein